MNELNYAFKLFFKNIRYSALCISVIALGIGMVMSFYTFMGFFMEAELPVEQSDRFVTLRKHVTDPTQIGGISLYDNLHFQYFKDNSNSFESLFAWRDLPVSISDGEYTESFRGAHIEPGLNRLTQIQPIMGRGFTSEEASFGSEQVVIISYRVWQTYYAGREDIIGHSSRINGEPRTIIGVMPENFTYPIAHEIWIPLPLSNNPLLNQGDENLYVVGFLAENVAIEQASKEIQLLQTQIKTEWIGDYEHISNTTVEPYATIGGGEFIGGSLMFFIFLLLVIFNAGNLFVVRGEERIQELAIRSAMGANHQRIAQALLLESFIVCFFGLLVGLGFAQFGINYLDNVTSNIAPGLSDTFWYDMSISSELFAQACVVTFFVWLVAGGLPAWKIARNNINELIGQSVKGLGGAGASRINKILVNGQLVISCLLLTAGVSGAIRLSDDLVTRFEDSESYYVGLIDLVNNSNQTEQAAQQYRDDLQQSLLNAPSVSSAFFTSIVPGNDGAQVDYDIEEQSLLANEVYPQQFVMSVSDGYFEALDISITQGRGFGSEDNAYSTEVAIVDQRLVDMLWPNSSAIGKRIRINPEEDSAWKTIVGVSTNQIQERTLDATQSGTPVLYLPIAQTNPSQFYALFRSSDPTLDYQRTMRVAGTQANRDIPINQIQSLAQYEESRIATQDFNSDVQFTYLVIAIYLTFIATYSLAARITARRQIEMGVRMALGAGRSNCLSVILKDGCLMVLGGISLGGATAILATYLIYTAFPVRMLSFDFSNLVSTAVLVATLMGTMVLLANYFPARKIVAMEPGEALHYE